MNALVATTAGRHELYSGYKGQRPPMPPELSQAIPRVREVLRVLPSCWALSAPAKRWTPTRQLLNQVCAGHASSHLVCLFHA